MSFKESDDGDYDEDEEMTTIYIFRHGQADETANHIIDYGYAVKNIKRLINGQYPRQIVSVKSDKHRFRETYLPLLSDNESVILEESIFPNFFANDFSEFESGTIFVLIGTLWNEIYPVLYHLGLYNTIELDDGTTDTKSRLYMANNLNQKYNKVRAWSRWAYRNGLKLEIPTSVLKDISNSTFSTEKILKKIKKLCDEERCDLKILPFSEEESDTEYLMRFQKYIGSKREQTTEFFNPEVYLISQAVNRCLKLLEIFEKTNQTCSDRKNNRNQVQNAVDIKSWRLSKIEQAIFLTMENIINKSRGYRNGIAIEILNIFEKLVDPNFSEQKNILEHKIRDLTNKIPDNDWNEEGDDTDWNFIFGV